MKRICLFAGFDRDGIVDDYVVYYIQNLAKFADVYYFADCEMKQGELEKLNGITKMAYAQRHGCYDFGSWAKLIEVIGSDKLEEYDRLLLVNDSAYGPLHDFAPMFDEMDKRDCNAWSMCGNKFMMSFFISLDKTIIKDKTFYEIFSQIEPLGDKNLVVHKYERGLSRILSEKGYKTSYYISPDKIKKFYKSHLNEIKDLVKKNIPLYERIFIDFRPNKVRLYSEDYIILALMGIPLLKTMFFKIEDNIASYYWKKVIHTDGNYPKHLIEAHIKRLHLEHLPYQAVKSKILDKVRRLFYEEKIKNNRLIIKIFKIPLYQKQVTSSLEIHS